MIGYIYFKELKIIIAKIDNVTHVSDVDKEIKNDSDIVKFGDSQNYIILENDTINLNVGDTIDLTGLEDTRDYFLIGKDYWYQEQIKKANEKNNALQETVNNLNQLTDMYGDTIDSIMFDILPNLNN